MNYDELVTVGKELFQREIYVPTRDIVSRPITPQDFGKSSWWWSGSDEITIPDLTLVLVYSIWSVRPIVVRLSSKSGVSSIICTGSDSTACIMRQHTIWTITTFCEEHPVEFSIIGATFELFGKNILHQ